MTRPISRRIHGLIDYAYVTTVAHLPEVVGFHKNTHASAFFRSLSATALASAALTRAEWGVVPVVSFKKHLVADVAVSMVALAAPWLFGFSKNKKALATSIAVGVLGLGAVALSERENLPVTKDAFEKTKEKIVTKEAE